MTLLFNKCYLNMLLLGSAKDLCLYAANTPGLFQRKFLLTLKFIKEEVWDEIIKRGNQEEVQKNNFGREVTFSFQVVIIATSNTGLNIAIKYI